MVTDEVHSCGREEFRAEGEVPDDRHRPSLCSIRALTGMLPVDDVEGSVRSAGILQHLGEQHGTGGHALRRLQQKGVAAGQGHGEHPQRDHGGEVERGDACAHAEGQAVGVGVHVFGEGGQRFSQHQGGDAAGVLNHLWRKEERKVLISISQTCTWLIKDEKQKPRTSGNH